MFEEVVEPEYPQPQQASHEDIERLAHALWEQRGCPIGSPDEDWLQAERELAATNSQVETRGTTASA